jgi:hypothetical protein
MKNRPKTLDEVKEYDREVGELLLEKPATKLGSKLSHGESNENKNAILAESQAAVLCKTN